MSVDSPERIIAEVAKETAKEAYNDLAKPALTATGQTIGLLPRVINAALQPIEIWVMTKEYNKKAVEKILEHKLKNVDPSKIVPPEPYVAVPALQAISYCMDCDELREMYASLLAASINADDKDKVHPSFVDVIRNMSPSDAKIMNEIAFNKFNPLLSFKNKIDDEKFLFVYKYLFVSQNCELTFDSIQNSLINLQRLGLIELTFDTKYSDDAIYNRVMESDKVKNVIKIHEINSLQTGTGKTYFDRGVVFINSYGSLFISICLN